MCLSHLMLLHLSIMFVFLFSGALYNKGEFKKMCCSIGICGYLKVPFVGFLNL
jgi:hypothetical protein